jgi:hypothetical protein
MNGKRLLLTSVIAAFLLSAEGGAEAKGNKTTTVSNLHIQKHLRVDGSSDLRGDVRARSGLHVTAGTFTDTIDTTGPVQIGGLLDVAGVTTTAGLSAGQDGVTTTGPVQGGSLTLSGDAKVGGSLQVSKTLSASGLQASAINADALTAGSITSRGPVTANTGTFSTLTVAPGGAVNFNNASITGVAGLSLTGNANLTSVQINTQTVGGSGGTQALTINQGGQTSSLSVAGNGILTVAGAGLAASALTVTNNSVVGGTLAVTSNLSVGGALTTTRLTTTSALTLDAPTVSTTGNLEVGTSGNLQLDGNGSSAAAHLMGNHDTRGQCVVTVSGDSNVKTCSITFFHAYGSTPIVVAAPSGSDPSLVTGYTVVASSGGFTVRFTTSGAGTVVFNYIVQG